MSSLVVTCGSVTVEPSSLPFPVRSADLDRNTRAMLGQEPSLFPHDSPVRDGDAVHLLRGVAWGREGIPRDEATAQALVMTWGRELLAGTFLVDGISRSGMFTLCSVTRDTVIVSSDPTGIYPTYLWAQPGKVMISSHERVLARAVGATTDLRGVIQTAAFGYAIGERTLHNGVRQLAPGATARIDVPSGVITVTDHPTLYGRCIQA